MPRQADFKQAHISVSLVERRRFFCFFLGYRWQLSCARRRFRRTSTSICCSRAKCWPAGQRAAGYASTASLSGCDRPNGPSLHEDGKASYHLRVSSRRPDLFHGDQHQMYLGIEGPGVILSQAAPVREKRSYSHTRPGIAFCYIGESRIAIQPDRARSCYSA